MSHTPNPITWQNRLALFFGVSLNIFSAVFLARLTIDVGTRLVHPFIPQFAAGLNVTIVGFSWLLFVRAMAGLSSPVFGVMADKYGRRRIMSTGLLLQAVGVIGLAFSEGWSAIIPMLLYGVALAAFIPAEQAYISDQVAFERRGRALAAIEFSWATAGIVAMPLVGWLIDTFGWQTPLLTLGFFSLFFAAVTWFLLPTAENRSQSIETTATNSKNVWGILRQFNVLMAVLVATLLFVGVGALLTIWSIWLTADFGIGATTLGMIATGIGVAELLGSGSSSLFIDRLGLQRGAMLGLLGSAVTFGLLPLTQGSLPMAVLGLLASGLFIEFSIVSLIPLYGEQAPQARATVFSLVAMGVSIGVSGASPVTAMLWERFGLEAVCMMAVACLLLSATVVRLFLSTPGNNQG